MKTKFRRGEVPVDPQLRAEAEAQLAESARLYSAPSDISDARLLHELQVHQIELEMQNEALQQAHSELEQSRDRYLDLYDFAPVGYCTVTTTGLISEVNLTAAELLGETRAELIGTRLTLFVAPESQEAWHSLLRHVAPPARQEIPEIAFLGKDGRRFYARLECSYLSDERDEGKIRLVIISLGALSSLARDNLDIENKYRSLYESMRDAFVRVDMSGKIVLFNQSYQDMLGYSAEELKAKTYVDLTPEKWHSLEAHLVESEILRDGESQIYEKEYIRKGGEIFPVELKTILLKDKNGRPEGMWAVVRDISARKQVEAELRASECRLRLANNSLEEQVLQRSAALRQRINELHESERFIRTTLDAISSAVIVIDENGQIAFSNLSWQSLVDKQARLSSRLSIEAGTCYLPCGSVCQKIFDKCTAQQNIYKAITRMSASKRKTQSLECEICIGPQVHWFVVKITRFQGTDAQRLVVSYNDITERKLASNELDRVAQNFKALLRKVEQSNEEKSKQLAREVHDQLGATLTMIKLGLATTKNIPNLPAPIYMKTNGLIELADLALTSVKRITASLRPSMLDTLGLVAAIQWHTKDFSQMTGIQVTLDLPESLRLAPERENAIFRIVQEALTNVAKHAHAETVSIVLRQTQREIILTVSDNGQGLAPRALQQEKSFGIIGMQERASFLGAKFCLGKRENGGTVMTLKVPIKVSRRLSERPFVS